MKRTLILFLTFVCVGISYGQKSIFRRSYFSSDSIGYLTKTDTLETMESLTLDFYKKHFSIPYYFPKQFIDTGYRDTTVVVWENPSGEKDYKNNWTLSYTYNNLSRVIKYEYSGCLICSQLPYTIAIKYDEQNRPLKFESRIVSLNERKTPDEEFEFTYDAKGDITQIKQLQFGKMFLNIEKL